MNILFLGNFSAEYSSENYYKKTLEKMGHKVISLNEGKTEGHDIIAYMENNPVDLFFWVHTHGWKTSVIYEVLNTCREKKITSFAYHLDLYLGIQRENDLWTDPFFKVDHFFTVDAKMAEWLNAKRAAQAPDDLKYAHGHFIPAGVFEDECFVGTPDPQKYYHDIIFTGSTNYHPEWPYRRKLIEWLKETYGEQKFGHYGPGGLPTVRGPELNNLYASAKIVIGDTLCKDFTYPYYSSDRLFEVCGRGGFLIYPNIEGLGSFYNGLAEVVYYPFNDFTRLKELIDHFLENEEARTIFRTNAFLRTKNNHTYRHRMTEIINYLLGEKTSG